MQAETSYSKNKGVFSRWFSATFVVGLLVSALIAQGINHQNADKITAAAKNEAIRVADDVVNRIHLYQYGLRGARGAIATVGVEHITRDMFARYSKTRDVQNEFPGARGFGFIQRVPAIEQTQFVENEHLDGRADFKVRQFAPHEGELYIIRYIEPERNNLSAVGLDIASELNRRQAADLAATTGDVKLTPPITLVQASGNPLQSFLILMPVYRAGVISSQHQPEDLVGWTYAPLVMHEVMSQLSINNKTSSLSLRDMTSAEGVVFYVAGHQPTPELKIYNQLLTREVYGRHWTIEFGISSYFIEKMQLPSVSAIFTGSLLLTVLISLLFGIIGVSYKQKIDTMRAKAKLAAIVESSMDGIIGKSIDGVVTSWNKGAERIFGFSSAEALGQKIHNLIVPPELVHEENSILERIKKGTEITYFDTVRLKKDGTLIDVSVAVSPVYDDKGDIIGASKTVRDITKQKAAEIRVLELNASLEMLVKQRTAELELAHRSLQTVLDAVPSMIGYWDKDLINHVANEAYHKWFQVEKNTIPGMHVRQLLGEEVYSKNRPYIDAVLKGELQIFERTYPATDTRPVIHALSYYLPDINHHGEVAGFYVIVHDVTEITESKRQLAAALRENQALLATINQQMLYSATDLKGKIIDVNDNFCRVSGYDRSEILGQTHRLISSGMHNRSFWDNMWRTVKSGKSWRQEICDLSKSGELKWFDTVIAPFIDDKGNIERYISLRSDITDRKSAEAEKNKITLLLSNVLRAASEIAIIATDIDGIVTIFNSGAEHMLGYKAEDIIGKTSPAIFHLAEEIDSLAMKLSREYNAEVAGFKTFIYKAEIKGSDNQMWTYVRKDGSQLQISLMVTAMRDENNIIIGYLGIATDITAELQNKQALISARDQLAIAAEVADLGIWTWTVAENDLQWNDRMFEMYDYPLSLKDSGVQYEHWYNRIHPDDVESAVSSLNEVIANNAHYDIIFRMITKIGAIRYIQAEARAERDPKGVITRVTGINRDITTQHELETWLIKAKEQSDAASAAKSTFLANMSHEIRTPMNAVLGMLQLILKTELNVRQQDYISKAYGAAKSLLTLLNDILDFSKIDSGKLHLELQSFDPDSLMHELGVILSGNQGDKNVEIIFDLDPELPQTIEGDRLRIKQILINLAGNALKFTDHGHVVIKLQVLRREDHHVTIRFSITDTGIGISEEQIGSLFSAFNQAEASISRRFGGTGLGLAISKKLVNLMGGELCVESRLGEGSHFWFDIPCLVIDHSPLILHGDHRAISDMKILVVDDNDLSRDIFVRSIQALGGKANAVDNGMSAVEQIKAADVQDQQYDVVLMDYRMPDLDGLQTADLIHQLPLKSPMPSIVMVTAFGREEVTLRQDQTNLPYVDLLTKPVTIQQLAETLQNTTTGLGLNKSQQMAEVAEQSTRLSGLRLLVVEDNAINREIAAELLGAEGAEVELADGGLAGISMVCESNHVFDVVIMDIQMPDIDGLEATRRIRADGRFNLLPIMAMTANASAADRQECLAAGMNEHVGKPIDMEEVIPRILELTGRLSETKVCHVADSIYVTDEVVEPFPVILKRLSGNIDLFTRTYHSFTTEANALIHQLKITKNRESNKAATALLHSLKGISGTMGAKALASKASELESSLKANRDLLPLQILSDDVLMTLTDLLADSLVKLSAYLEQAEPLVKTSTTVKIPWAELKKKMSDLLPLLESGNLAAIDQAEILYEQLSEAEKIQFEALFNQINALDFASAIKTLNQSLNEI